MSACSRSRICRRRRTVMDWRREWYREAWVVKVSSEGGVMVSVRIEREAVSRRFDMSYGC